MTRSQKVSKQAALRPGALVILSLGLPGTYALQSVSREHRAILLQTSEIASDETSAADPSVSRCAASLKPYVDGHGTCSRRGSKVPSGGVLGSGSLFKPLVVPLDYASSVQSDQEDQPKRPPVKIAREPWKAAVVHSKAWADLEDDKRTSILEVWKLLILTSANGTKVGENLASMQSSGATDLEIAQCLRDTFASKSTATLRARSSSLAHFARWKASAAVFPLLEPDAYRYACFLRSEGAPASRGPRFKEAMNFAGALLGVDVREVTSSSRIQGAVNPGSSASAVRKKAPLTVAQVRALEEFVCGAGQ